MNQKFPTIFNYSEKGLRENNTDRREGGDAARKREEGGMKDCDKAIESSD